MDFFEVLSRRHSVREFSSRNITDPEMNKILQAAGSAPSAGNLQAYEIVIIRDQQHKVALARAAYDQHFLAGAPAILVFCADPGKSAAKYGRRGSGLFCIQDATIAASYAQLAATALGLAAVWIGAFDEILVAKLVGDLSLSAFFPLGIQPPSPILRRAGKSRISFIRSTCERKSKKLP